MRKSLKSASLALFAALSIVRAGLAQPAAEPVPAHESFTMESKALAETRHINVYTPPGYADGAVRYPVLYMPDGGLKEDFPHIATTLDAGIRAGEIKPMILVGVENTERRRDMTGPTEVEEDRKIAPRVGGSASFRRFFRDELMPEVGRRYRTTDETGIIGESLAGLFILETFFLEPGLFDTAISLDPSLWWNNEDLVKKAAERLKAPGLRGTLYLAAAGEESNAPTVSRLADVLRTNAPAGLTWQYKPRPDLRHDNIYRGVAPGVLRELFGPINRAPEPRRER